MYSIETGSFRLVETKIIVSFWNVPGGYSEAFLQRPFAEMSHNHWVSDELLGGGAESVTGVSIIQGLNHITKAIILREVISPGHSFVKLRQGRAKSPLGLLKQP